MKRLFGIVVVLAMATIASAASPGDSALKKNDDTPPKLTQCDRKIIDGCTFKLLGNKYRYTGDHKSILAVEMTNPTEKPLRTKFWVKMMATPEIPPPGQRTPMHESFLKLACPPYFTLWAEPHTAKLAPGESRTVTLKKTPTVPEGFREGFKVWFILSRKESPVWKPLLTIKEKPLKPREMPSPKPPAPLADKKNADKKDTAE